MREIALFVEDLAHRLVIGGLVQRLAVEHGQLIKKAWLSTAGGHGQVVREFRRYLRDLDRQGVPLPDLIIVATDANCIGLGERTRQIKQAAESADVLLPPLIEAIPDPHIERWLLLDGEAFSRVVGKGCDAPDQKCSRDRYKDLLAESVIAAGNPPNLGGIEFAEGLVEQMDLERARRTDDSLENFLGNLEAQFRLWQL